MITRTIKYNNFNLKIFNSSIISFKWHKDLKIEFKTWFMPMGEILQNIANRILKNYLMIDIEDRRAMNPIFI